MKILVANLGSTSFKYLLFRFSETGSAVPMAKGGYERVERHEDAIADALKSLKAWREDPRAWSDRH